MEIKALKLQQAILFLTFLTIIIGCSHNIDKPVTTLSGDNTFIAKEVKRNRTLMVGTWYRTSDIKLGGKIEELAVLKKNGLFEFHFKQTDAGGHIHAVTDMGVWGTAGNIVFTVVSSWLENGKRHMENMTHTENYQAYEILKLDNEVFEYKSLNSGNVYKLVRVGKGHLL